mmetsp:Transcript_41961/g.99590  ORF Transcript_41961/g.99590 Transcript_41961/m.99590 type:complete len:507 (+) Transcript_41961:708-2228(+)
MHLPPLEAMLARRVDHRTLEVHVLPAHGHLAVQPLHRQGVLVKRRDQRRLIRVRAPNPPQRLQVIVPLQVQLQVDRALVLPRLTHSPRRILVPPVLRPVLPRIRPVLPVVVYLPRVNKLRLRGRVRHGRREDRRGSLHDHVLLHPEAVARRRAQRRVHRERPHHVVTLRLERGRGVRALSVLERIHGPQRLHRLLRRHGVARLRIRRIPRGGGYAVDVEVHALERFEALLLSLLRLPGLDHCLRMRGCPLLPPQRRPSQLIREVEVVEQRLVRALRRGPAALPVDLRELLVEPVLERVIPRGLLPRVAARRLRQCPLHLIDVRLRREHRRLRPPLLQRRRPPLLRRGPGILRLIIDLPGRFATPIRVGPACPEGLRGGCGPGVESDGVRGGLGQAVVCHHARHVRAADILILRLVPCVAERVLRIRCRKVPRHGGRVSRPIVGQLLERSTAENPAEQRGWPRVPSRRHQQRPGQRDSHQRGRRRCPLPPSPWRRSPQEGLAHHAPG